jgi:hypothetical protein
MTCGINLFIKVRFYKQKLIADINISEGCQLLVKNLKTVGKQGAA